MEADFRRDFDDLNRFRGVGEDPVYHPPTLTDRPRQWPLDRWGEAAREPGYDDFTQYHWRGVRLLKDPETLSAYHNLLWELRPRTIIELGVFSGGSLLWFRDLTAVMGLDCQVVGVDRDVSRCQIPPDEMSGIVLHEGDCAAPETLERLRGAAHPLILVDDAHSDTFTVMKWAVVNLLEEGDYFIIEDMISFWHRYSPRRLEEYLGAFRDVLTLDMVYANSCAQLDRGVLRRSGSAVEH